MFFTRIALIILMLVPVSAWGAGINDTTDTGFAGVVKSLQSHFCPDRRVAVFDIEVDTANGQITLKGETDLRAAYDSLFTVARIAFGPRLIDSITVLPHPSLADSTFGIVVLSVGNVRSRPGQDEELATQVTMGSVVKLLKRRGGYYYVQSHDTYLGWLESDSFRRTDRAGIDAWAQTSKVIVTEYFDVIRSKPSKKSVPVSDVVIGNILKAGAVEGEWRAVTLADGRSGYLPVTTVSDYDSWSATRNLTGENIEQSATMFMGVPYLWGGTSSKGMDCSGFTKTVFRLNGLELSRDASQQVLLGRDVEPGEKFRDLTKGDLLFFGRPATVERPERIVHVAIYLEDQLFIHSSGMVRFGSFDPTSEHYDEYNLRRFVRARRVIPERSVPEK